MFSTTLNITNTCFIADCVFFGCPFDSSSTYRMGARFGPAAVRRASQMTSFKYAPWFDKDYSKMKIYDAGEEKNLFLSLPFI